MERRWTVAVDAVVLYRRSGDRVWVRTSFTTGGVLSKWDPLAACDRRVTLTATSSGVVDAGTWPHSGRASLNVRLCRTRPRC
jgi:hypothetical protein